MEILGYGLKEYKEAFRIPFLALVGWMAVLFVLSFVSFGIYAPLEGISSPLILLLGFYVGWDIAKRGMRGWVPAVAGLMFGFTAGLVWGLTQAALLVMNSAVASSSYDELINTIIKESETPLTRGDVISSLALLSLVSSPFVLAVFLAVLSGMGGLAFRYFGPKSAVSQKPWESDEPAAQKPVPEPEVKKQNKKFRKK